MQRVLRLPCTSPSVLWRRPGELHLQCQGHHCHCHHCHCHHWHWYHCHWYHCHWYHHHCHHHHCHLKIINVFSSCWNKPYPIYEVVTILRCLHLKQVLLAVTPSSSPRQCHYHHIDPKNGQLWQNLIWSCELCQTSGAKWKKLKELEPHEEARRKNGRFLNSLLASS